MLKRTPLFDTHKQAGAKLVDFGGWEMPLHYGSQIDEHQAVRTACGMFDASHMTVVDIEGNDAHAYLSVLLANDVSKLKISGQALYSCMLNHVGGVIDDLIVYFRGAQGYRLVVNASTREQDLKWMNACIGDYDISLIERPETALIAVQGPQAKEVFSKVAQAHNLHGLFEKVADLKRFAACEHNSVYVGRTGYTGEEGYEIMLPAEHAAMTWAAFAEQGAVPCGLGCRDTLRIEAGLNLYGTDMDQTITPLEAGLAWTVSFDNAERAFNGRAALEKQKNEGDLPVWCGVVLAGKGVIRGGYPVTTEGGATGVITSGTFSPTLKRAVGFVRLSPTDERECLVEIRGRQHPALLRPLPFVRNGTIRVDIS